MAKWVDRVETERKALLAFRDSAQSAVRRAILVARVYPA